MSRTDTTDNGCVFFVLLVLALISAIVSIIFLFDE